jgi:hypothetical protein
VTPDTAFRFNSKDSSTSYAPLGTVDFFYDGLGIHA